MATRILRKRRSETIQIPTPSRKRRNQATETNISKTEQRPSPPQPDTTQKTDDIFTESNTGGIKNLDIVPSRRLRPQRSAVKVSYIESDEESTREKMPGKTREKVTKKEDEGSFDSEAEKSRRKKSKKTKDNPYGLTPGITPFPDWPKPSKEDCMQVYDLLAELHGEIKQPEKIPAPSLEVSGCGEVPSVLDAMIRTRLSAHTSSTNSNAAFKGLVNKFGTVKVGVGKGSVDWDRVRTAPVGDIVEAIKCGGLAQTKGRDIKNILEMVHEENRCRRDAFMAEKKTGQTAGVVGAKEKTQGQKDLEIMKADQNVLSLDHIHGMHPDEAMQALVKYPGIGVKTASCVILFCLRMPSFAVDTHVHRISSWLQWVPPKATRDDAFGHLEVRVPDHLKYGLHKLFVQHGRNCARCRANTSEGSDEWHKAVCPLEGVIDRVGKRKSTKKVVVKEDGWD